MGLWEGLPSVCVIPLRSGVCGRAGVAFVSAVVGTTGAEVVAWKGGGWRFRRAISEGTSPGRSEVEDEWIAEAVAGGSVS